MSPGADLFVICKNCGSEVSPYITECPYCGNRLRRRAPKLPRERERAQPEREGAQRSRIPIPALGRLRRGEITGLRADAPPYLTLALIAAAGVAWVLTSGAYLQLDRLVVVGPLHGDWWKLLTYPFGYLSGFFAGVYVFASLLAVAVFGWLLERRHGGAVVAVVFWGTAVSGALVALAVYPLPILSGASAPALGLLAAWAVPDLLEARAGRYYDGDLLGAAAIAVVLLAIPFAYEATSWLAGFVGGAVGLVLGYGLSRVRSA
ncbi:MAG TPA: rhomboid family intramembrane serine protease [Solirubrobacteraceae bacterium]|nr:rhomboid family intramembrane serine protease [Solirubrobacteraceae bacterium]